MTTHKEITLWAESELDALFGELTHGRIDEPQYEARRGEIGRQAIAKYEALAEKA